MNITIPAAGWTPRPHQMGVWADMEAEIENILLLAHRRWGKDEIGLNDCAVRASKKPANYIYCLPEQEHARRAIWTAINPHTGKRRIEEAFPTGFRIGNAKEQEMAIDLHSSRTDKSKAFLFDPNPPQHLQSRVQFLGSDNYNAIIGASPFGIYFSEWAVADPQALAMLRPIIAENHGFMRFLTTSRGENHAYRQMKEMAGKIGWAVHYMTAHDTGVFSQAQLDTILAEYIGLYGPEVGGSLFRQEYLCSFESVTPGSYYIDLILKLEKAGRINEVVPLLEEPVYAAFDIGWSDAMAIWYVQVRADNQVDCVAYEEYHRLSIPDLVTRLRAHPWNYGGLLLPHDARHHEVTSGFTTEDILTRAGFPCYVMPQTDDDAQIQSVRMLLPRCSINRLECERGITCLKAFHQRFKHDALDQIAWSPKPVHDWSSHSAKAFATLAYFASSLRQGAKQAAAAIRDFMTTDRRPVSHGGTGWMR